MIEQRIATGLAIGSMVAGCGFLLLNPLRLAFIANTFVPFLLFNLMVMFLCGGLFLLRSNKIQIRPVEFVLCLLVISTALMTNYIGRNPTDILTDLLRPILFLAVVIFFRNYTDVDKFSASKGVRFWLKATGWVTVAVVVASWLVSRYIISLYPAYSSVDSIFGMGWLLATGNIFLQIGYLLVLVLSGKRGVYLAAFLALLICYRYKKLSLPYWISLIAIASFICLAAILNLDKLAALFLKSSTSIPSDVSGIINLLSGGRIEELRGALAAIHTPLEYFFGAGLGFAFKVEGFEDASGLHRNLHFTPANLAIYYGIPFVMVMIYYFAGFFRDALSLIQKNSNPVIYSYAVYCIASMFFLFTEFSVFAYVNFAISCGIVSGAANAQRLQVRVVESSTQLSN
ncbi:hypothetical protein ACYZT4_12640 [Pseudomonas sp. GB2N2]